MSATHALAAKAKAMYGEHLTQSDYQELLRKRSVAEIAGYLKHETHYRTILAGINETGVHRGYLEMLIRQRQFFDFTKLIRYGDKKNEFYKFGILQIEIKQILLAIRLLKETEKAGHIAQLPLFANALTTFDLQKLIDLNTYDELLKVLHDTPYAQVLRPFKPKTLDELDYTGCELALNQYYVEQIKRYINKEFSGLPKAQLDEIFDTRIELDNITKIYRLKKYYSASPEDIKKVLNPISVKIARPLLESWIETKTADEFIQALGESAYKSAINHRDFIYIEYHTDAIMYNINKHYIRFATDPNVVLIAYMNLLEIETRNIIDIIEGVRYKLEADKIAKLLIY